MVNGAEKALNFYFLPLSKKIVEKGFSVAYMICQYPSNNFSSGFMDQTISKKPPLVIQFWSFSHDGTKRNGN